MILLASGNSKRFQGNKLLAKINNKPIYMNIVDKVKEINFNKIIMVTQYDEIKESLLEENIEMVMNFNSELGISHSIKLGIEKSQNADAYMFMVCDQPFISLSTIEALIDSFIKSNKGLACVKYKSNLGNPTIFSRKYKRELMSLNGDVGGKCIINRNLDDLVTIEISDELEITDIDTRKDLENIIETEMSL